MLLVYSHLISLSKKENSFFFFFFAKLKTVKKQSDLSGGEDAHLQSVEGKGLVAKNVLFPSTFPVLTRKC